MTGMLRNLSADISILLVYTVMVYSANGFDRPAGRANESLAEVDEWKFSIDFMVFLSKLVDEFCGVSVEIAKSPLSRNIAIATPPITTTL